MSRTGDWRPTATLGTLKKRATLMAAARAFFVKRDVLEVETPVLTAHSVTDCYITSLRLDTQSQTQPQSQWLRTSPEYHMKRLLAAGWPDIYQIAKSFRAGETGSRHQPEFTLAEWYRHNFTMQQMIDETGEFICALFDSAGSQISSTVQLHSYREAFRQFADIDPDTATVNTLRERAVELAGWNAELETQLGEDRHAWLDYIASHMVYPALPRGSLQAITNYPAEQAMLARLNPEQPQYAERFEVFLNGMELANGFHELADAKEQKRRFEVDNQRRLTAGHTAMELDTRLLEALDHGLPDCCGVAVGLDRVLMLANGNNDIAETISFPPGY